VNDSIIESLRFAPGEFRRVLETVPNEALTWSNGEWSICAVMTHLAIGEVYYSQRFHRIVNQNGAVLFRFRADEMIPVSGPPNTNARDMLERWAAYRAEFVTWLEQQKSEAWDNYGIHPERGSVTLRAELESLYEHDLDHLEQIKRIKQEWEARFTRK
jgi:hypothetical protein